MRRSKRARGLTRMSVTTGPSSPRRGLPWRHTALTAAIAAALALLPNVAQAQSEPARPGSAASQPNSGQQSADSSNNSTPSAAPSGSTPQDSSDTAEKAKAKASDWGEKIKTTSARLIDTTQQVLARIAEKIPGTDAYQRAQRGSSDKGSEQSSSARP